ncbi:MAG: GntP family permease [Bacteroidetes bacterium]|nr:GntP family permease [Fibrella sp.]
MNPIVLVLGSIAAIILLSSRYKLNTFLVLLGLAVTVGLLAGFPAGQVLTYVRTGFGETLEKIGLLIVLGTILGSLLDKTNATLSIANFILSRVGLRQTPLAVTLIGFLIGLPIFCDSGFIVLSGLVLALAQRLGRYHLRFVLSLAGALYSVHCLVPPHPGITAAVGILDVDIGRMILLGTLLAIPGAAVSYGWAKFADVRFGTRLADAHERATEPVMPPAGSLPAPTGSFLAILVPIALIAAKPLLALNSDIVNPLLLSVVGFAGDPVVALSVGVVIAVFLFGEFNKSVFNGVVDDAIYKAGPVLVIVGAGGAFGEIIKHLGLETTIMALAQSAGSTPHGVPLWLPFLLTVVFKTAQGSSTVAVLSVASILQPLLPGLGAATEWDRLLVLGAMGAGSMTLSHANDAYFWVVSRFGRVDTDVMLKSYSSMSALMGLVTFLFLWLIQALV